MRSVAPLATAGLAAALLTVVASPGNGSAVRRADATTGVTLTVDAAKGQHRDQPARLRGQLRVAGVRAEAGVPGAGRPLGRQQHEPLQLHEPHLQHRVGLLLREHRRRRRRHPRLADQDRPQAALEQPGHGADDRLGVEGLAERSPVHLLVPEDRLPGPELFDFWDSNCGNGVERRHEPDRRPDHDLDRGGGRLRRADGAATWCRRTARRQHGGVRFYELDNEPDLWNSTHRDVHPDPLSARASSGRSPTATARAVKDADPTRRRGRPERLGLVRLLLLGARRLRQLDGRSGRSRRAAARSVVPQAGSPRPSGAAATVCSTTSTSTSTRRRAASP